MPPTNRHHSLPLGLGCLSPLVLVAGLTPAAHAGDPPSATYPLEFGFGQGYPLADVAPYAPCDQATYVFSADMKARRIQRYAGTGSSNWLQVSVPTPLLGTGPIGLAANDRPGSIGFGRVLATDTVSGWGVLWQFDTALVPIGGWGSVLFDNSGAPLARPHGVALDEAGDAYVVDQVTRKVYRYPALGVAALFTTATQAYGNGLQNPTGVSVDHNGRVHVAYMNGEYVVYEPSGVIASNGLIPTNLLRGVCALHPCADGFTLRLSSGGYWFDRTDWDWITPASGAVDLSVNIGVPPRPINLEYQKSISALGGQPWGWQVQRSGERLYVAAPQRIAAFGQSYDSVPVPPGRRAWYRFEEAHDMVSEVALPIADYLGTNVATAGAVPPRNVEGMVRCGLDTRGGTAFASAPDSPQLDFGTGSISIEGWLRSEQRTGVVTVLDKRVGTGAGYSVYMHLGRLGFQTNIGTGFQNFTSTPVIADGRWRHFAIVLDRDITNTLTIYVDGVAAGSIAALAGDVDNSSALFIGRINPSTGGTPFIGGLDEFTLYGEPLTAAQVSAIASARSAGKHLWASPPM